MSNMAPGFTKDQWESFLKLVENCKGLSTDHEKLTGMNITDCEWLLDSGASYHMTGNTQVLTRVEKLAPIPVTLPDGNINHATCVGQVRLSPRVSIKNVLLVPGLKCNLISVGRLIDDLNCDVYFTNDICVIQDLSTRIPIGVAKQCGGVYYFHCLDKLRAHSIKGDRLGDLWHSRLGHPSKTVLRLVSGLQKSPITFDSNKICDACMRGKQTRDVFAINTARAIEPFELIHCDIWGPYRTPATSGARYFLTIVDDFSRAVWIHLLCEKGEVFNVLKHFIAMTTRQFNKQVKVVRADNGLEFQKLRGYFLNDGIIFQTSCVYTPQQNGRVERKHRHILDMARTLRFHAHLPIQFWGECVLTAGYLINRLPSPLLDNKSPYELLFNKLPSYNQLRVFGCLCYAHNKERTGDKFAPRGLKCVFLGYAYSQKGWKVFDLDTKRHFVSRDVSFVETIFPFAMDNFPDYSSRKTDDTQVENLVIRQAPDDMDTPYESTRVDHPGVVHEELHDAANPSLLEQSQPTCESIDRSQDSGGSMDIVHGATTDDVTRMIDHPTFNTTSEDVLSHAGQETSSLPQKRVRRPPAWHHDYDIQLNTVKITSPPDVGSSSSVNSGNPYPLSHYVQYSHFSVEHRAFLAAISATKEPGSFREAVCDPRWREAMQREISALERTGTWTLTPLPPGKRAIYCKWVYKIKYKSDGTIDRYKARLVVCGNRQVQGIDYSETFAPVAKMVTVRTLLMVAASRHWELHQMDVDNAFLHGDLHEEVYMHLPPGYSASTSGQVCRLLRSLYGLRQAPRCWFSKLTGSLKQYGFEQSHADYSLFTLRRGNNILCVLVYVDDIITGNNHDMIVAFKHHLASSFPIKDLGRLKYFLGLEVARNSTGIFLCQRKYVLDILAETGLTGAKPVGFPMIQNHSLQSDSGPLFSDPERYRRLVGKLIYLTLTRPDISYSVHILSQFMHQPRQAHWDAVVRVLRYLKGHPGQGILLCSSSDLSLTGFCDSDWASCPITRRSVTGYLVLLGGSPISWRTKKQVTVSRSSAEAEYRSMATLTCELIWLKNLLHSLGVVHQSPIPVYCDNKAAIHIASNPVFHERTKHIELDCHFIRDHIQAGLITPLYRTTTEQLADLFTKALGASQFSYLLTKMGIIDPHAPS
ncbi:unnamed protein product [Cuscuta epithymum]|uniref:Integrase catalytic domain-containing protein n=1 Tax=Cuscuta epithymum TaxID=186058 RepID=A0AAV0EDY9_9ASTE|nr:unnamed protein product [Cuscuta epithymum]